MKKTKIRGQKHIHCIDLKEIVRDWQKTVKITGNFSSILQHCMNTKHLLFVGSADTKCTYLRSPIFHNRMLTDTIASGI